MTVRVLLADDHPAVRSGLRALLETGEGIEVVGEAADGAAAVGNARALRPDVVLMDLRMPGTDGIAATRAVVSERLAEVLVLTTFDLDEYVVGALQAGAAGFLLKSAGAATLVDAVRRVAGGQGVLAPEVTRRLLDRFVVPAAGDAQPPPPELAGLTPRERDVLGCLGEGMSNADVAAALTITEATAKTHVSRVLAKLGLTSRMQAALLARSAGVSAPRPSAGGPSLRA
ncbi:response regulator [Geodermatophilus nigrescens]|uniref:Two component transcriptional regulator, LuxR family n=1 Tax=Geodermatophilus nigrescens TaxID=1070870 RepID=A0A1M5JZQ6_9ACTN|nr:response regulator transcription factor [Geodermatophilus nigrescens]SHG45998.1 two component transcriptional regulator, LuxR family [Geodermatophilus nigrescens]